MRKKLGMDSSFVARQGLHNVAKKKKENKKTCTLPFEFRKLFYRKMAIKKKINKKKETLETIIERNRGLTRISYSILA